MTVELRVIIDHGKLANWLRQNFGMQTAAAAFGRITEIDPLNETITIDGQQHTIPADCYVGLGYEESDWNDEP